MQQYVDIETNFSIYRDHEGRNLRENGAAFKSKQHSDLCSSTSPTTLVEEGF